jgi:hypothetical protein
MSQGRQYDHHPYQHSVEALGGFREQMKVVDTQRGFETGDSELVEGPTGVVELHCLVRKIESSMERTSQVLLCMF